jgi:hypothetical protein
MPIVATAIVIDPIAVANGEALSGAIPPDRVLHEPGKRRGSAANPRYPWWRPNPSLTSNDRLGKTTCLGPRAIVLVWRVVKGLPWRKPGNSQPFSRRMWSDTARLAASDEDRTLARLRGLRRPNSQGDRRGIREFARPVDCRPKSFSPEGVQRHGSGASGRARNETL